MVFSVQLRSQIALATMSINIGIVIADAFGASLIG
jgi:hypothetical protein